MVLKHKLTVYGIVALSVLILTVYELCSEKQSSFEHPPMRIAATYWPGTFWIDIARTKGWFDEAGLRVELVDSDKDYYAKLADFEAGLIDTIPVWIFDLVKRNQGGARLTLVLATDESNGSEALVGAAHIHSVQRLVGARIGVAQDTALVYELDSILSRFGMNLDDVSLVDMEPERAGDKLAEGSVDAVMTWEPHVTEAVASGGHMLFDSSNLPGIAVTGLAFSEDFIQNRPDDIRRMLRVWYRATNFIQNNPEKAFAVVAEVNDVSPEEVSLFAQKNRILGLRDNALAFTYASGIESLFGSVRKINRFLIKRREDSNDIVNEKDVLDRQFVHELAQEMAEL